MNFLLVPGGKCQVSVTQLYHSVYQSILQTCLCWSARTTKGLTFVSFIIIYLWGKGNCKHGCYHCSCSWRIYVFFFLSPSPPSLKASYFLFQPPFYINYLSNLHIWLAYSELSHGKRLAVKERAIYFWGWRSPFWISCSGTAEGWQGSKSILSFGSYSNHCRSKW